jgi:hypothetical protein
MIRAEECANPVKFLEAVMRGPTVVPLLRIQAAGLLLKTPKYAVRYLSRAIDIEPPNSIEEARSQIKQIIGLERLQYIGCDEAREQVERLNAYIESERATDHDLRLAALEARDPPKPPPLTIEGGLGDLPGAGVQMPPREISSPEGSETAAKGVENPNPWGGPPKDAST